MPAVKKVLSLDEVEAQMMFELPTRELMHHTSGGKHVTTSKAITANQCTNSASTTTNQVGVANPAAALGAAAVALVPNINISPSIAIQINLGSCNQLLNNG